MKKYTTFIRPYFSAVIILNLLGLYACGQESSQKEMGIENKNKALEVMKTDEEWKKELTDEQYYVLRQQGTEAPFSGKLLMNKEKGIYKCAACGNELFTDEMKFDSHCGWPSFDAELGDGSRIKKIKDYSFGMVRTEIVCARCGGHLGHIFDDGPTKTGQRYCVNSLSIDFTPESDSSKTK